MLPCLTVCINELKSQSPFHSKFQNARNDGKCVKN